MNHDSKKLKGNIFFILQSISAIQNSNWSIFYGSRILKYNNLKNDDNWAATATTYLGINDFKIGEKIPCIKLWPSWLLRLKVYAL